MKRIIIIILAVLIGYLVYTNFKKQEVVKIPDAAIRFRVLANSNSPRDQKIKENVRDRMQKELYSLLINTKSIDEARVIINEKIPYFENVVSKELENELYSYDINYGMHKFPEKTYKGVVYEEGDYESLLVTLGEGKGDNWWCVLFPPLCLLEAEENIESNEIEYKSFIKELLQKYF